MVSNIRTINPLLAHTFDAFCNPAFSCVQLNSASMGCLRIETTVACKSSAALLNCRFPVVPELLTVFPEIVKTP